MLQIEWLRTGWLNMNSSWELINSQENRFNVLCAKNSINVHTQRIGLMYSVQRIGLL